MYFWSSLLVENDTDARLGVFGFGAGRGLGATCGFGASRGFGVGCGFEGEEFGSVAARDKLCFSIFFWSFSSSVLVCRAVSRCCGSLSQHVSITSCHIPQGWRVPPMWRGRSPSLISFRSWNWVRLVNSVWNAVLAYHISQSIMPKLYMSDLLS